MSRPHDPPRSFLPFGNPFRMLSPKGSNLSPRLLSLLNNFEMNLAARLRKLIPKDKNDILSLSWMKLAMQSLCETHNDIKTLIAELELPVSDWDEKWIDVYLDISVKLLDLCIAFSSELSRLNQGHLLLQCFLHNLESNTPDQYIRARSSLDSWRQHICLRNPRVQNFHSILVGLVESLDMPRVKNSAKGKVLMQALYGVKVETVYVCGIFAAAFSGSAEDLLDLTISDKLLWAQAFSDLQATLNGEIRNERATALKELDAVDTTVKKLYPMVQNGFDPAEEELFKNSVSELRVKAAKLSHGLDLVSEEADAFFKIVLTGRDALLCNLRPTSTAPNPVLRSEEQAVR